MSLAKNNCPACNFCQDNLAHFGSQSSNCSCACHFDLKTFKWDFAPACCYIKDCRDDGWNGHWKGSDASFCEERRVILCWSHYKEFRAYQASQDPEEVRLERVRIAAALEAWHKMWSKPHRIAFTDRTVTPNKPNNLSWLLEFAKEIRVGTFDIPHGDGEPDAARLLAPERAGELRLPARLGGDGCASRLTG